MFLSNCTDHDRDLTGSAAPARRHPGREIVITSKTCLFYCFYSLYCYFFCWLAFPSGARRGKRRGHRTARHPIDGIGPSPTDGEEGEDHGRRRRMVFLLTAVLATASPAVAAAPARASSPAALPAAARPPLACRSPLVPVAPTRTLTVTIFCGFAVNRTLSFRTFRCQVPRRAPSRTQASFGPPWPGFVGGVFSTTGGQFGFPDDAGPCRGPGPVAPGNRGSPDGGRGSRGTSGPADRPVPVGSDRSRPRA
jgi:hypothetical protein